MACGVCPAARTLPCSPAPAPCLLAGPPPARAPPGVPPALAGQCLPACLPASLLLQDPYQLGAYLARSAFLADINNEVPASRKRR